MCGLYGYLYYGKNKLQGAEKLLEYLANEAAIRGEHATGYAYTRKGKIRVHKAPKPASKMYYTLPTDVRTVMGHTRFTTQGDAKKNYNNHPFIGKHGRDEFAFAHNGVLDNEKEIRKQFKLKNTKIQTDSYVACQLMASLGKFSMTNLKTVGENVEGMFTFTFMDNKDNLYIVKNDNPLVILHFPELQLYAYASTETILIQALMNYSKTRDAMYDLILGYDVTLVERIPIGQGDIVKISSTGKITRGEFTPPEPSFLGCSDYYYYEFNDAYDDYLNLLKNYALERGITEKQYDTLCSEVSLDELEYIIFDCDDINLELSWYGVS